MVYCLTTLGSVIGFMMLFGVGKFFGKKFFHEKDYKHFSADRIAETEVWVLKYGYFIVLGNRFLPGVRSVISIVTGISMLKPGWVFLWALVSSSIWNLLWIHTGFLLGNNWDIVKVKIGKILGHYNIAVTVIVAIVIVVLILKKRKKNEN